ncbi:MAG: hypothetical protein HY512_03245 [Candidatus Aenigmarchaeota archaeon]|nr:hypothetical protein [Candidatus Aenigmarchaeota archaeon]
MRKERLGLDVDTVYKAARIAALTIALGSVGCVKMISRDEYTDLRATKAQYKANMVEIARQEREDKQAKQDAEKAELSRLSNLPASGPRYPTREQEFRQPRAQPSGSYPTEDGFPWGEAAAALGFTILGIGTAIWGLRYMSRDQRPTRPAAGAPTGEARPVD